MIEPGYLGDSRRPLGVALIGILALAAVIGLSALWWLSSPPRVQVKGDFPRVLTRSTPLELDWQTAHGARSVAVRLEQDGTTATVFERRMEAARWTFWREPASAGHAALTISSKEVPALRPGRALVVVEVQSNDLRGQVARIAKELPVVLESPKVTADGEAVFFRRGGTGVVTFTAGGGWSEAGVRVGPNHFPSYPVKGRPERRVSLFAFPPNVESTAEPVIYARNQAGEEAEAPFPHRMTDTRFRERVLELGDGFLRKVFAELDGEGEGSAPERFLRINANLRRANDAALARLAVRTGPKPLWKGPFQLLPRGKAEALYGDHRTYRLGGKALNAEWHLGVDMASTRNAPVPAANEGRVVFAGKMGIYGNAVVVDHGLSVQSLYAHLSSLTVREGDGVSRGQEIGKSGMTGLAGGDHLHLGLMVAGVFVDPVEWSFGSWMDKTLQPAVAAIQ